MKSYCVRQKKQTECTQPSGYKTAKNGRATFWCTCAECGIRKTRFFSKTGKGFLSNLVKKYTSFRRYYLNIINK